MNEVKDVPEVWRTDGSVVRFTGHVVTVRTDRVAMPDGDKTQFVERDVVDHPGSVGVLALDAQDRVLLIFQYRHPAGHRLWEIPAGLRDVAGEPLWRTAQRELAEEAGQQATEWATLVDVFTSPGMTNERSRVFLARGLSPVDIDFERVHEEADMPVEWVPLDEAVRHVLSGDLHNSLAATGILAAHAARATGFRDLRAVEVPEG
jgi:8-oxo-dGDP phosphatase